MAGPEQVSAVPEELSAARVMARLNALISSAGAAAERLRVVGDKLWGATPHSTGPGQEIGVAGIFAALNQLDDKLQAIHKELDRF